MYFIDTPESGNCSTPWNTLGISSPTMSRMVGTMSTEWWYWSRISPRALMPFGHEMTSGSARAAGVLRVALEHLERCRECDSPTGGEMVVGVGSPELVEQLHVLGQIIGVAVEELVLVDGAVRRAFAGGAVVGGVEDDRVVELPGLAPGNRSHGRPARRCIPTTRPRPRPYARTVSSRLRSANPTDGRGRPDSPADSGSGLIGVSFVSFGTMPFSIMRASTQVR